MVFEQTKEKGIEDIINSSAPPNEHMTPNQIYFSMYGIQKEIL